MYEFIEPRRVFVLTFPAPYSAITIRQDVSCIYCSVRRVFAQIFDYYCIQYSGIGLFDVSNIIKLSCPLDMANLDPSQDNLNDIGTCQQSMATITQLKSMFQELLEESKNDILTQVQQNINQI